MLLAVQLPAAAHHVCLADEGQRAIVAADDGTIRSYAVEAGGNEPHINLLYESRGSGEPVMKMALAQDERSLFSVSADKKVRHWWAASGPPRQELNEHRGPVHTVRFSPDSVRLATAGADGALRVWDWREGALLHTIEHGYAILDVSFRPDGARLVTAGLQPVIRLFDAEARPVRQFSEAVVQSVHSVYFHPSGSYVLSGGGSKQWQMWAESSDTPVRSCPGHNGTIRRAVWNRAATRVASIDDVGELFIWDTGGTPLHHRRLPADAAHCLAYTPDGSQLVIGTRDSRLIVLTVPQNAR
jgi:WD40 repeat protein